MDGGTGGLFAESLAEQHGKVEASEQTPSARVIAEIQRRGSSFFHLALELSQRHREDLTAVPLDTARRAELEQAARELLKVDILYAYPEWSAAALYEAGRCFQELSNPVDARKQFEKVAHDHGATNWAQLAEQRLAELSQSGLPGQ